MHGCCLRRVFFKVPMKMKSRRECGGGGVTIKLVGQLPTTRIKGEEDFLNVSNAVLIKPSLFSSLSRH